MELYKKYRPNKLADVVGNDSVKAQLRKFVTTGSTPHFLLFTGPSGNGKTTIARILANGLKCQKIDYIEMNCATNNGIDVVRDLQNRQGLSPAVSPVRVIVVDECHNLTKQAQEGLLKMLEDTPPHLHYMFCTSDPAKLLNTIRTRATQLAVEGLNSAEMKTLINRVVAAEKREEIEIDVMVRIIELANGSARKALVLLEQVLTFTDSEDQLKVLIDPDTNKEAFQLAQMLQRGSAWSEIMLTLKSIKEEPEGIRRIVAGYFATVAMGAKDTSSGKRALQVLEAFEKPWYDTPKAQMVLSFARAMR